MNKNEMDRIQDIIENAVYDHFRSVLNGYMYDRDDIPLNERVRIAHEALSQAYIRWNSRAIRNYLKSE